MKKALLVWGGWEGHQPREVAEVLARALENEGFEVEVSETLDAFADEEKLKGLDLIIPNWNVGAIENEQLQPLLNAVNGGVGIAGVHGGMACTFPQEFEYHFMVGGQFAAHPGGGHVTYAVHIVKPDDPIVEGIEDFEVTSEQYYMHFDPAIEVLAATNFGDVVMPVTWKKSYGEGRVFYCSLGHSPDVLALPPVLKMVTLGMLWAARGL